MSWDGYLDTFVSYAPKDADKSVIIGSDGAIWTSTTAEKGLNISPGEAKVIATAMFNDDPATFQSNGIHIGGLKYRFLRKDDDTVFGKLKDNGCLTIRKSAQTVLIGHTKEGSQVGNVNIAVDKLVNYLISVGY